MVAFLRECRGSFYLFTKYFHRGALVCYKAIMTTATRIQEEDGNDANLVALWLTVDKTRWAAGLVSGLIAGVFAMAVAGIVASAHGMEFLFPVKLFGTILLGSGATEYGNSAGVLAGAVIVAFITMLWGFVYGHFVRSSGPATWIGMGFTWGAFSWVFMWNLTLHSFKTISAAEIGPGVALLTCMAYGLGMSVIGIIDPLFRKPKGV
jgi:hypothetical protein